MAAGMGAAYASQRAAAHDMYSAATAAHSRHAAAASAQSHYSSLLQLQNTMRQASMAGSVAAGGLQGRAAASAIDGYAAGSAHSHYGAAGLTAGKLVRYYTFHTSIEFVIIFVKRQILTF